MGRKRYYCSHCDDFVSRGTRSRHPKQIAEREESASEAESDSISDLETNSEVHSLEIRDSFEDHEECFRADLASGDCGYSASEEDSNENPEAYFANLDEEDRRLFDEEFIHKSIGEPDDEEGLYHEQLLHNASQEVWDDLLEENVLDDLDESNFPGAIETDPESINRNILINWLLLFICYWWTYCNIADRGIEILLKFFHAFFSVLFEQIPWMALFSASFPSSLYMLKKYFGLHKDCFQKFVVCPKCNSLYNYDSAYETVGGRRLSRKCSFVEFPNHRRRAHRKSCNEVLLKEVKLQDGKLKLYPKKVYSVCYNSIIETLKLFLQRPGFASRCELWRARERTSIANLLSDVIHGTVWREIKGPDG